MHCPSCGHESSLDQKFCRKCGFNLEPVSKLFTGETAIDHIEPDKSERERLLVRRMFRWISIGCLVLLFGVILLIINRGFIHEAMFQSIASLIILGGVSVAFYGLVSSIMRGTYSGVKASPGPQRLNETRTTNELPEARTPIPLPSVTERTTQLIGEDKPARTPDGTHASGVHE